MRFNFIWYNITMFNSAKRSLIVLVGVLLVLAPAAQASPVLAASCGMSMPMMQSGPHDCCKTSCDCTVKTPAPELAVDLPAASPRFESSLSSSMLEISTDALVSTKAEPRSAEESPPAKDPLYQTYSDYRL